MSYSYKLTNNNGVVKRGHTQSPEVTIGNLTAFTTYEFKVAAVNSAGQGPWSAFVSGKTKEAGMIKCTLVYNSNTTFAAYNRWKYPMFQYLRI